MTSEVHSSNRFTGCLLQQENGEFRVIQTSAQWERAQSTRKREFQWKIPFWLMGLKGLEDAHCTWIGSNTFVSGGFSTQVGMIVNP